MDFLFYNNTIIYVAIALICAVMLIRDSLKNSEGSIYLKPNEAVNVVNQTHGVFIDVRPEAEFKKAHIPQAKNIPLDELTSKPQKLPKKPLILVGSGKRQLLENLVAQMRKDLPGRGVFVLEGGINAWRSAQFPLKTQTLSDTAPKSDSPKGKKKKKESPTALEKSENAPISTDKRADEPLTAASAQEPTMHHVTVYMKPTCPYCVKALGLLQSKGVQNLTVLDVAAQPDLKTQMVALADGRTTVPQIFIGNTHVGGCDDLHALEAEGKLDALLGR